MIKKKNKKIVVIGGGTGTFSALRGLKKFPVDLTAVVTMMDSGGSSGRLRDELGVLPPGDIRQCLVALSSSSTLMRNLFNYRFPKGDLAGHTFGNIFLSALEKTTGDFKKALTETGKILRINGKVVPVTFKKSNLCVKLADGTTMVGEKHIDVSEGQRKRPKIIKAFLKPKAEANEDALSELEQADFILIGPGDLYTSIIPNLLVDGVIEAIKKTKAKKIFVLNLMTKCGQTTKYKASDHVRDLEQYLGSNVLDMILVNKKNPSDKTLKWYKRFSEEVVIDDLQENDKYKIIKKNLIKDVLIKQDKADKYRRSIIRHDPQKLAKAVIDLIS
ncbi:YvcK family protein [Patescibacteria group bacterium]|nr:YvcK family protein [Patescibacteria group bacterium]